MKMHPKPMIRHTAHVVECNALVTTGYANSNSVHIVFNVEGKTQRVVLTVEEAKNLAASLIAAAEEAN